MIIADRITLDGGGSAVSTAGAPKWSRPMVYEASRSPGSRYAKGSTVLWPRWCEPEAHQCHHPEQSCEWYPCGWALLRGAARLYHAKTMA